MIVLDTSVLSLALRRRDASPTPEASSLARMIEDGEDVAIPGIVLQELLSGIRESSVVQRLRQRLEAFPVLLATTADHVRAAEFVNRARANGVAITTVDALIAAIAVNRGGRLFTVDSDFGRLANLCGLELLDRPA